MKSLGSSSSLERIHGTSGRLRLLMAAICGACGLAATTGAEARAYNPENLDAVRLGQVSDICQSVMGLRPSEPTSTVWGAAVNPGLVGGENHYQGCVISLSDTLRSMGAGQAAAAADADCRAKGLAIGSPALARCVLAALQSPTKVRVTLAPAGDARALPTFPGSFFNASHREIRRREQLACASLGLNPIAPAFDSCVNDMDGTFYSIDNPRY